MLRIYLIQNLYDLADEATVAEVVDSRVFSDFCGVESSNQVPDGDTLGRFRNLLIKNGLQERLFARVVEMLKAKGMILKKGTIVDSTIISAPSSTKNAILMRILSKRGTNGFLDIKRISVLTRAAVWCIPSRSPEQMYYMILQSHRSF